MRTWPLILLIGIAVSSCHSKEADEGLYGKPVTDSKAVNTMSGTWYATPSTYVLLTEKGYPRDTMYIRLQEDSSFKAHLPDYFDAAGHGGHIFDAIGSWKLRQDNGAWKLGMAFESGRLFRHRTFTNFDIVWRDSVLTLSRLVGNPAKKQVLQFSRTHKN